MENRRLLINLYDFPKDEVELIAIISYMKNSNFSIQIDSTVMYSSQSTNYNEVYIAFDIEHEYKIKLLKTGVVYTLSAFEIEGKKCNACLFYNPPDNDVYSLSGYELNGQRKTGYKVDIRK